MNRALIELLDCICCGVEILSRSDMGLVVAGIRKRPSDRATEVLLDRLLTQEWLEKQGRGGRARFRVPAKVTEKLLIPDPQSNWDAAWDGQWRVLLYDVPERRRKDRIRLYRVLRHFNLGFLQRSVWIWPHDLTTIIRNALKTNDAPECFSGSRKP